MKTETTCPFDLGIELHLRSTSEDGHARTSIKLPKGCGLDAATAEIDRTLARFRKMMLELHIAWTEGREPDLQQFLTVKHLASNN